MGMAQDSVKEGLRIIPEAFFDIFAYFLPGAFLLVMILHSECEAMKTLFEDPSGFKEGFAILLGGYIFGHLLTTLSAIVIVVPLNMLAGNPVHTLIGLEDGLVFRFRAVLSNDLVSKISLLAKEKFGSDIDKHTFFLCENYIRLNHPDTGFLIRKRHAFEHLSRNLCLASVILIFFVNSTFYIWFFGIFGLLCFLRYLDYRVSWPKVVYESFFLVTAGDARLQDEGMGSPMKG